MSGISSHSTPHNVNSALTAAPPAIILPPGLGASRKAAPSRGLPRLSAREARDNLESPKWVSARGVNEAKSSPVTWIVDEYIPANTVTLLSSVSASGKSVLALHLGLSLLHGLDWLGLKCRQSTFAYWDQDNPDAWLTDNRICAIRSGLSVEPLSDRNAYVFRTIGKVVGDRIRILELIAWLKSTGATVLFVDTLASVNPYSELDPNDMARAMVDNFFPMVEAGITPIILHHIGKDFTDNKGGSRRRTGIHAPRGSSALVAAVGAAFNLDRDGDTRRIECVKPRYGAAPTIKLDYDEHGYPGSDDWRITMCRAQDGIKVSQEFLTQLIIEHNIKSMSSRNIVKFLSVKGYSVSQSSAHRALSRVK